MKKGQRRGTGRVKAKAKAKAAPKRRPARPAAPASSGERRLLHELEVHQLELELQNEELRAARLATEAGLERYTQLFDFAPTGYVILTPEGAIREINHAGAKLLGFARANLSGRPFETFLSAGDHEALAQLMKRTLEGDATETAEVTMVARSRVPRTARLTARALTRGGPMVLLAFEDVTEPRAREAALHQAQTALRQADQRKDDFLATLSHELRNPLAPIKTSLYLLDPVRALPGQTEKAYAVLVRQVNLLTRLVDDLLDVTRITRGKIRLERHAIDLVALVRQTLDDHRPDLEASDLRLVVRLADGPFFVDADAARVVQALSNLLGNAQKFTPPGGTVTVTVAAAGTAEVAVRVADTGAGVDPELLPHMFEPFVQGPRNFEQSRGGVGLGLAMVKALVELHGGSVTAQSAGPGRGTEVTLRLPLSDALTARAPAPAPAPGRGAGRRVLLIDDNVDHAQSLQVALGLGGHEVRVANDGAAGLALAREWGPEVIVSDIGLPTLDGYTLARAVRSDPALEDVFLIAVSGFTRSEDLQRSAAAGFNRHFGKPVTFEELDAAIRDAPYRLPQASSRGPRPGQY